MKTKNGSATRTSRRHALGVLGAAGVTALVGCGGDEEAGAAPPGGAGAGGGGAGAGGGGAGAGGGGAGAGGGGAGAGDGGGGAGGGGAPSCVVRPEQIEGPYFVDENLDRSDIRSDPSDGSVKDGVPLRLVIAVSRVDSGACSPLRGAVVDIWQCDAEGTYSDVVDTSGLFDTRGQKFLRGSQVTNESGVVEFTTIYPGWYPGRAVHIHFKIRTDPDAQQGEVFTSQLYMDDAITDEVHAQAPYNAKGRRDTLNSMDLFFADGGNELTLQLSNEGQGYVATFDIGLGSR